MEKVLGIGVELAGDFALVDSGDLDMPRKVYAASVVGPDVVVRKFEADIVSAWDNAHYAWGDAEIYGAGGYRLLRAKRGDGLVHGFVVSKQFLEGEESQDRPTDGVLALDGDLEGAFETWLRRYTALPFLADWVPALLDAGRAANLVGDLQTLGRQTVRGAMVERRLPEWQNVLCDLVRSGVVTIPEGNGPNGAALDGLDLDGYLKSWGPALAERAQTARQPLWRPGGGDERSAEVTCLRQPLYEPQADVTEGLGRALAHRKGVILCGAMGTGKTRMGMAIAHRTFGRGGGYRVLVQCPKHLLHKWVREVEAVVPGASARIVWTGREMLNLLNGLRGVRPARPEFYVIGRDSAKLGWFYRPGAVWDERRSVVVEKERWTGVKDRAVVPAPVWRCPRCGQVLTDEDGVPWPQDWMDEHRESNRACPVCAEPLWQADGKRVRRCAIAHAVKVKGRGVFDLLIADEVHELKGGATAQGVALGTLASMVRKVVLLTGTLFGGMAMDVFYLLWRIAPGQMLADGQAHRDPGRWVQSYGRLETEITSESDGVYNRASRSARRQRPPRMRPGISPAMYGRHLVDTAAFVDLEDVAPWLPRYTEIPDPVDMDADLAKGYAYLERTLKSVAQEAAAQGDLSVYAAWLQTGLGWPDKADSWPVVHDREGAVLCRPPVVQPGEDGLYPKERRLLELLEHERARGRKCAIYETFTGRHDMLPRLDQLLRMRGFRPMVLRADKVKPEDREEWIARGLQAGGDVLVCHPKVVETGLDLYAFPTIIWLQTGTSLFPVRQASRRSYRIGQTQDVEVRFLAYSDTLQTAQLLLMAQKLKAAAAAEGSITAEGLRVLAGDDDGAIALAQMLMKGMDGLQTAEALWRQAARIGMPAVVAEGAPKIQTVAQMLPVIAVTPKGRRGKAVMPGVKALAIDFDSLGA